MLSTFGALAGIILSGPRVYFAMARDGMLFQSLCELHPKYHTPHRSILMQAVWCSVLALTGTYRGLFTRVVYIEWIFFGVMTVGLILLRRRPDFAPAYRVWGYPLVPILFILSTITIAASRIWSNPLGSLGGLAFTLIGLPVYWTWRRYLKRPRPV